MIRQLPNGRWQWSHGKYMGFEDTMDKALLRIALCRKVESGSL